MESNKINCICKESFEESNFQNHFQKCRPFISEFRDFDLKLSELLKLYSESKDKLIISKYLLKLYIIAINHKLKSFNAPNKSQKKSEISNSIIFEKNVNEIGQENEIKEELDNSYKNQKNENAPNICQICQKYKDENNINYLECIHPICYECFEKEAENNFFEMKCNICKTVISEQLKKQILQNKFPLYEKRALINILGKEGKEIIKCPNKECGEQNIFEQGEIDYNIKDANNQIISKQAAENYAKNRCRCGFCKKEFCKQCFSIPYHLGKTCEENKHLQSAIKCRFCNAEIKKENKGLDEDVCNEKECKERYLISCKKKIPCGHKCFGVDGEKSCPPCLEKKCEKFGGNFDQDKDSYCPICFAEGLGSAPIIVTTCGHYIHYHCIKKNLETKWIGPKITFNHCLCPTCKKWLDIPTVPELQKMIEENKALYELIKAKALKRLKFENLDKDKRLTDPNSPWFGKEVEFAMKSLSYYMCYICKKPYFAGRRECGNDPNMDNDDPNKNYDPKDCVCGKDAKLSGVAGVTDCPIHGKYDIEYKCRFCCKPASWFCWGTTHFCEDCHKRQNNGDYVSKYPKDKLPKCNKDTCQVGGNHPPNGEEFSLGCGLCRSIKYNNK